jgi:CRP/FNR family transcriptional regulator
MAEEVYSNLHDLVIKKGRLVRQHRRQVIQTSDSQRSFYLVESGYIKRYLIRNDGSLSTDLIYGPGDVFSLMLIFRVLYDREILDSPEIYYYEALTDNVQIYSLSADDLKKYVSASPILYRDLLNEAGKRMTYETYGLENIAMKDAYKRLAHRLAYYARHFGEEDNNRIRIVPPLTHQDIADLLSLTRETVSTCMTRLRKKGLIDVKDRQIIVASIEKLNEEAFS